jgi:hypothetical protein
MAVEHSAAAFRCSAVGATGVVSYATLQWCSWTYSKGKETVGEGGDGDYRREK